MKRILVVLLMALACVACSRGPGEVVSESELEQRLENNFESGLFDIASFRRTGSGPFRDVETGTSGIFIYYDAELEFLKDYSLTDWRGLNLGTLAYVVGATELGVKGFSARGNAQGDVLQVQGRMPFEKGEDGEWLAMEDGTHVDTVIAPPDRDMTSMDPETALTEVRSMLKASHSIDSGRNAVIVREFDNAVAQIELRRARERGDRTLGGGPLNGTYDAFSVAFSRFASDNDFALHSFSSEGSVDNASRIQAGKLDFGLVQSDVAQLLYQGWVEKNVLPSRDLRAVASLWPEAVHLVTLESTGIQSIEDLADRRVAIGVRGSGTRLNAIMLGQAAGLGDIGFPEIREIDRAQAIRALERGDIDALFLTEAVPAPSLQALARRRKDVRLVQIDQQLVEALSERFFPYYPMVIQARTYPQQVEPYATLGLASVLMTNAEVDDAVVEQILELLLAGSNALASDYYRAAFVNRETMRLGVAVPLHPAAKRFYESSELATELDRVEAESSDDMADPTRNDNTRGLPRADGDDFKEELPSASIDEVP